MRSAAAGAVAITTVQFRPCPCGCCWFPAGWRSGPCLPHLVEGGVVHDLGQDGDGPLVDGVLDVQRGLTTDTREGAGRVAVVSLARQPRGELIVIPGLGLEQGLIDDAMGRDRVGYV